MKLGAITQKIKKICSKDELSLCLHIGMPKTGTTAIQHFLDQNREALALGGAFYPKCGIPDFQHAALVKSIVSNHYPWAKFNDAIDCFDPAAYLKRVIEECRQRNCSRVLMSSEFFWAAPAMQSDLPYHTMSYENLGYLEDFVHRCGELFRVFDKVQIVVYLRRQDDWLDSFFGQQVKDGFAIPDKQQLLDPRIYLLYSENLQVWARDFGKENILVRIYDDQTPDVIDDFCRLIGLNSSRLRKPERDAETVNTRLTPLAAETMRKALTLNIGSQSTDLMKKVFKETSFTLISQNRQSGARTFPNEFLTKLFAVYQADNEKLIKSFPAAESMVASPLFSVSDIASSNIQCSEQDTQQLLANLVDLVGNNEGLKE